MNNAGDKTRNGKTKRVSKSKTVVRLRSSSGRRVTKKWSPEENQAVMDGVEKFGDGNWKLIFNYYYDILKHRSTTDIKDKYRIMTTRRPASSKEKEPRTRPNLREGPLPRCGVGRARSIPLPALTDKGKGPLLNWGGVLFTTILFLLQDNYQNPAKQRAALAKEKERRTRVDKGKGIPRMSPTTLSISEPSSIIPRSNEDVRNRSLLSHDAINAARKAAAAITAGSGSMDGLEQDGESVPPHAARTVVSSIGPHAAVNARTDGSQQNRESVPPGAIPTANISRDGSEQNRENVPAAPAVTSSTLADYVGVHIEDDQNEIIQHVMDLFEDQQKDYREKAVRELDEFLTKQRQDMRKSIVEALSARRSE
ncbi:hypothetical protein MKW98_019390 [Papaver atlanticum]|uniref:Myb-like domain-containing protein n=1 Tax=Papaver atlanticum TaxID=357466 RepID=A0AAD4S997_9MAGN|nr:hypothetical protein MKW98_019390 [Papaver atlanticum]